MTGADSATRVVYITRHGESEFNRAGKIGGDGELSLNGNLFAVELGKLMDSLGIADLSVWTSTFKRTKQTAKYVRCISLECRPDLDELNGGICDGLTYEEIAARFPEEFAKRDQDKFLYRYPKGESYEDVHNRLAPVYEELRTRDRLLIVCHQAVARCILAHLLEKPPQELPYIDVPLHTVFKLSFIDEKLVDITEIHVPIAAIDTYRSKPKNVEAHRSLEEAISTVPPHEDDKPEI